MVQNKIFIVFFIFISITSFSQTPKKNLEKYQLYRERLKYFYKLGTNPGECQYASISGMFPQRAKRLNFGGDQTIEMAWFIGVMATEFKLQAHNKQDIDKTLRDLYYALLAYKRLDECEDKDPWNLPASRFDGFFMRGDMPSKTFIKENAKAFNKNITPVDTFGSASAGTPFWVENTRFHNSEMSQDQAIHILMGMSLVVKCFPDKKFEFIGINGEKILFNFHEFSKKIVGLMISYIKNENKTYGKKEWIIYEPSGKKLSLGGNATFFSYGFSKVGQKITGKNYIKDINKKIGARLLWELAKLPTPNEWNTSMACILAAIGDSWGGIQGTDKAIYSASKKYYWDTYYTLLWQFMNNKRSSYLNKNLLNNQLNSAPENGTYFYGEEFGSKPEGGWASNNRFRNTKKEQLGRDHFKGNYNGLDFMLLYNLYQLTKDSVNN